LAKHVYAAEVERDQEE